MKVDNIIIAVLLTCWPISVAGVRVDNVEAALANEEVTPKQIKRKQSKIMQQEEYKMNLYKKNEIPNANS